uniref:7TM_GPCR_Srx domain-containing protein n=1 Tax=Rhabditophanes sp. KR3021 TaxID=114890 RepID=A0AC35UAP6_9BILA
MLMSIVFFALAFGIVQIQYIPWVPKLTFRIIMAVCDVPIPLIYQCINIKNNSLSKLENVVDKSLTEQYTIRESVELIKRTLNLVRNLFWTQFIGSFFLIIAEAWIDISLNQLVRYSVGISRNYIACHVCLHFYLDCNPYVKFFKCIKRGNSIGDSNLQHTRTRTNDIVANEGDEYFRMVRALW